MARGLNKAVQKSLLVDYRRRDEEAETAIRVCLETEAGEMDPHGAYAILKPWYRHVSTWVPNPSWNYMEKARGYFHTLYKREEPHPHGLPLAKHVEPVQVNNADPSEVEVETAVHHLIPVKADRHTHLHMEHFKQWIQKVYPGES